MSFWDLTSEDKLEKNYEAPGGGGGDWFFADGQEVVSAIEQVTRRDGKDGGGPSWSLQWGIMAPEKDPRGIKMKNRKIFQSLYPEGSPFDDTPDKRKKTMDKARRFMLAIDTNAGNQVFGKISEPTAEQLQSAWAFKPMTIRVGLMKDRVTKAPERNYVQAIGAPKSDLVAMEGVWSNAAKKDASGGGQVAADPFDDPDIPF